MIDASRRGEIEGLQAATDLREMVPDDLLDKLAHHRFDEMRAANYAHIEPEEEFVRWFKIGFRTPVLLPPLPMKEVSYGTTQLS